jgi:coiled-coil domain-containing protein 61
MLGDSISGALDEYEHEWDLDFHGTRYLVVVQASAAVLSLEVEQYDTNDRWSAEFTSQYIEEITHKAGSFKKYSTFVKMLMSSFSKESDSVTVDLLTYADLEALKQRKLGHAGASQGSSATMSQSRTTAAQQSKRYVILTYSGEFDRVHYPLPLAFEEIPNPEALRRTIRRLRMQSLQQIAKAAAPASEREREMRQTMAALRQENTELRHRLRQTESRLSKLSVSGMNSSLTMSTGVGLGAGGISGGSVSNASMASGSGSTATDLHAANARLRKQIESMRSGMQQATIANESLRQDIKELQYVRERESRGLGVGGGRRRSDSPSVWHDLSSSSRARGTGKSPARHAAGVGLGVGVEAGLKARIASLETALKRERSLRASMALHGVTNDTRGGMHIHTYIHIYILFT